MYAQDSIDLLQNSGIQFKKHEEDGIDPHDFAELLMTSGIVLIEDIKWLSFHRFDIANIPSMILFTDLFVLQWLRFWILAEVAHEPESATGRERILRTP